MVGCLRKDSRNEEGGKSSEKEGLHGEWSRTNQGKVWRIYSSSVEWEIRDACRPIDRVDGMENECGHHAGDDEEEWQEGGKGISFSF